MTIIHNNNVNSPSAAGSATGAASSTKSTGEELQDRFLKLLVASLNNQDPMNPMDNAQITSQMAQVNTVVGIEQLNTTTKGLADQFAALQVLQGTNMIGRTVLTPGNSLATNEGKSTAAFDLDSSAANVKVSITTASGELVGSMDMGSMDAGRHYFTWDSSAYKGDASQLRFNVTASNGATNVAAGTLSPNAVVATSAADGKLMLELSDGSSVDYNTVKAVF